MNTMQHAKQGWLIEETICRLPEDEKEQIRTVLLNTYNEAIKKGATDEVAKQQTNEAGMKLLIESIKKQVQRDTLAVEQFLLKITKETSEIENMMKYGDASKEMLLGNLYYKVYSAAIHAQPGDITPVTATTPAVEKKTEKEKLEEFTSVIKGAPAKNFVDLKEFRRYFTSKLKGIALNDKVLIAAREIRGL